MWKLKDLPGKKAYPEDYLDFTETVGAVFERVTRSGVDIFKTLDEFLASPVFEDLNIRFSPKFLNMTSIQLLESLSHDFAFYWENTLCELEDEIDPDEMYWAGKMIASYHWQYSADLIEWTKYCTCKDVYDMYYPFHEASTWRNVDNIKELYEYRKQNNILRTGWKKESKYLEEFY